MINYRKGKTRYKVNELGSLYVDESKLSKEVPPIIYIGGQMEHRCHILEQTGFTGDLNHNTYTGSWMYDYPLLSDRKSEYNAKNFSQNLLDSLREAKLREVILVTQSFGGLIGAHASKSDLISKVICVHSPLLGTPLANLDLNKCKMLLTKYQNYLAKIVSLIVNSDYGFEKDNYNGMLDVLKMDLNKILVVGSYLDRDNEKNKLLVETYDIIETLTGYKSDGVVIFEPELYRSMGINYVETEGNTNHFESCSKEYIDGIVSRVLTKDSKK